MTIDDAFRLVNFIINAEQQGKITPTNFNTLAPVMQLSVIDDRIGNLKKKNQYGWGFNQKVRDELWPLLKEVTIPQAAGRFALPADYLYVDKVNEVDGSLITPAESDEMQILIKSQVKPPITGHAKYSIYAAGMQVSPSTISSIQVSYLRLPNTPIWNYTESFDRATYAVTGGIIGAGNSQDFEVSPLAQFEICAKILAACGCNLNLDRIIGYSELQETKGA